MSRLRNHFAHSEFPSSPSITATLSTLFRFPFPTNDRATSRAFPSIRLNTSTNCLKRFIAYSYLEKLARTSLPLMGSSIFSTPLLLWCSALGSFRYSSKVRMLFLFFSKRSTLVFGLNSEVKNLKKFRIISPVDVR